MNMNITVSALPSLAQCPQFCGSSASSDVARFGTAFHRAMETGDLSFAVAPAALADAESGQSYSRQDIVAAFDWATAWQETAFAGYGHVVPEIEGELSLIPGRRIKIDVFALDKSGKHATVVDWKSGRSGYAPETNEQGIGYAVALLEAGDDLETVTVVFCTPFTEGTYTHTFSRSELPRLRLRLKEILGPAFDADAPPTAGDACKYCGKFNTCKAVADLTNLEFVSEWLSTATADETGEEMARLRDLVTPLERLVTEIKAAATAMRADRGIEIPGYAMYFSKSKPRTDEVPNILEYLESKYGLDKSVASGYLDLSITNLKSLIGLGAPPKQKTKFVDQVMTEMRTRGWVIGGDSDETGVPYLRKCK